MTMVEYKQYIYNKISQIQCTPQEQASQYLLQFQEAGFEAMKNDPEYGSMGIK